MKLKKVMGLFMTSALVVSSFAACGKDAETNADPTLTTAPVQDDVTPSPKPTDEPTPVPTEEPAPEPEKTDAVYSFDAAEKSQALYFQDRGNGYASWNNTEGYDDDKSFFVTNRSEGWHGTYLSIDDQYIGKVLHVSYYAKHDNPDPIMISCTLQINKPDGSSDWPERASSDAVPSGEWTLIEADIPIYPDGSSPIIYWEATDTLDFYIDNILVTVVDGAEAEPHYADLVVDTPDYSDVAAISLSFDDDNLFFGARGDSTPVITSGGHDDDFAMSISGRTASWNGAQADLTAYNLPGRTINLSYYVKAEEEIEVNCTLQEESAAGTGYNRVASSGTLTPGEWTLVSGSIVVGADTTQAILYFESNSDTASFMIDEVSIAFDGDAVDGEPAEGEAVDGEGETAAGGGANEVAGAPIEAGSIVFYNSFETANGNFLDGGNSYNYASVEAATGIAHDGNESVLVKGREYDTAGSGLRLSATNGVPAADLMGHKVELSVWVYFEDGAFTTAPDSINFTIWNRQKKIDTDADGNAVYEVALEQVVNKGEWTLLTAVMEIADGTDNGMLLIGTQGEVSETGYLTSFYMDQMTLTVIE